MSYAQQFITEWNKTMSKVTFEPTSQKFISVDNGLVNLKAHAAYDWFSKGCAATLTASPPPTPKPVVLPMPVVVLGPTGEWDYPGMGYPKEWDSYGGSGVMNLVKRSLKKAGIRWVDKDKWECDN